jgi:hypothetical protein
MRQYKKPIFTTKHYETIVNFLVKYKLFREANINSLMEELCDLFSEDNKKFNEERFYKRFNQLLNEGIQVLKDTKI